MATLAIGFCAGLVSYLAAHPPACPSTCAGFLAGIVPFPSGSFQYGKSSTANPVPGTLLCFSLPRPDRSESIRTGFMLSQGGEFAFVLLSLANQLRILPTNLNQLLIIVVSRGDD